MNSRTLTLASTGDAMIFVMEDDELNAIAQSYCNLAMKESITVKYILAYLYLLSLSAIHGASRL